MPKPDYRVPLKESRPIKANDKNQKNKIRSNI